MYNFFVVLFVGIWTSVSVFSQNNFYDNLRETNRLSLDNYQYEFEPDAGSTGVEVAPLPVNSQDEDIPVYEEPATSDVKKSEENNV